MLKLSLSSRLEINRMQQLCSIEQFSLGIIEASYSAKQQAVLSRSTSYKDWQNKPGFRLY